MAGTTNEKLERLRQTKADLKAALIERGKTPGDVFSEYPDMVRNIGDPAAPEIEVSESGLITATASGKITTEQLPTEAGKTVNAGSIDKVVATAGSFVTGDIKVAAVDLAGGANVSGVTAEKDDVREFKVFVDAEGNEKVGTKPTRTASDITVKKRHVTVPAGIYDSPAELEVEPVIEHLPQPSAWSSVRTNGNRSNCSRVNVGVNSNIILPSGVQFYYNGMLMPELPAYATAGRPYACIIHTPNSQYFYAIISEEPVQIRSSDRRIVAFENSIVLMLLHGELGASCGNGWSVRYIVKQNTTYTDWYYFDVVDKTTDDDFYPFWWSNHDICIDTTNEVYWSAQEALTVKPKDPDHYYYGGVLLPKVPDEVLADYPYCWIRYYSGTYELFCLATRNWYFYSSSSGSTMRRDNSLPVQRYRISRSDFLAGNIDEWTFYEENTTQNFTCGDITSSTYAFLWTSHNIPSGSSTSSSIQFYHAPARPE